MQPLILSLFSHPIRMPTLPTLHLPLPTQQQSNLPYKFPIFLFTVGIRVMRRFNLKELYLMKLSSKEKIITDSFEEKLANARELSRAGQHQAAIQFYHKALFLKESVDALVEMGEIYESMLDHSSAILFYKRSLQLLPRPDIKEKVQKLTLVKGLELLETGSAKNILLDTSFEVFIKRYPFLHRRMLNKANECWKESSHLSEHLTSCLAYLEVNQRKLALDSIENCLMINEKDPDIMVLKGIINWSLMDNRKGFECFWKAWEINPKNEEVGYFLEMVLPEVEKLYKDAKYDMISKDFSKCRVIVKKALEMYPHHTRFLILSSYLHRAKQEYQDALAELQIANKTLDKQEDKASLEEQLRNQISLTYNEMGVYLFKHEKFEESIKLFTEGLSYKPKEWGMYSNRGDCYRAVNDYVKALSDYQAAYQIEKKNDQLNFKLSSIFNMRGIALFNSKNFQLALAEFNQSIKFSPRCAGFYISKAKCLIQLGLKKEGVGALREALRVEPSNSEAEQMVKNLEESEEPRARNQRKVILLSKDKF